MQKKTNLNETIMAGDDLKDAFKEVRKFEPTITQIDEDSTGALKSKRSHYSLQPSLHSHLRSPPKAILKGLSEKQ